jgi:hypothetical protein
MRLNEEQNRKAETEDHVCPSIQILTPISIWHWLLSQNGPRLKGLQLVWCREQLLFRSGQI